MCYGIDARWHAACNTSSCDLSSWGRGCFPTPVCRNQTFKRAQSHYPSTLTTGERNYLLSVPIYRPEKLVNNTLRPRYLVIFLGRIPKWPDTEFGRMTGSKYLNIRTPAKLGIWLVFRFQYLAGRIPGSKRIVIFFDCISFDLFKYLQKYG